MDLPPELIGEIISHLPLYDRRTLRSCSLIARSWVYHAQKRLFETVVITRWTHHGWVRGIPPGNLELLDHVRSFEYSFPYREGPYRSYGINSLVDYLLSFHKLKRLILSTEGLELDLPQSVKIFSAFRCSLSSLTLSCPLSSRTVITFVNCFPNLVDLKLHAIVTIADCKPVPPLSQPLRGKLSVIQFAPYDWEIFDRLSNPSPELDELVISGFSRESKSHNRIVASYAGSIRYLRLLRGFERKPLYTPEFSTWSPGAS